MGKMKLKRFSTLSLIFFLSRYISLYRDLGTEDEADSNYHSGSQESLSTNTACSSEASATLNRRQNNFIPRLDEENEEEVK